MDSITRQTRAENTLPERDAQKPKNGVYWGLSASRYEWPSRFWLHDVRSDFEDKFDTAWLVAALRSGGFNHVVEQLYMAEPDELAMDRIRDLVDVLYGLGDPLADLLERSVDV
jgi:hypothetical protein